MDTHEIYWWLTNHPKAPRFRHSIVKVNPETERYEDDMSLNTAVRFWFECGDLECSRESYEKGLQELYRLVKRTYGNYEPESEVDMSGWESIEVELPEASWTRLRKLAAIHNMSLNVLCNRILKTELNRLREVEIMDDMGIAKARLNQWHHFTCKNEITGEWCECEPLRRENLYPVYDRLEKAEEKIRDLEDEITRLKK